MTRAKTESKIRLPAKASIWYILSSAVARSVGVLGTPIFTRLLTASEYGQYPIYNTWLTLFSAVLTLEMTGGVLIRGLQKYADRREEFLSAALGLCLSSAIIGGAVYLAFYDRIEELTGLNMTLGVIMLFHIMLNAIVSFYTADRRYCYSYKSVALINLVLAFGIPFLSVALIILTPYRGEARIIASAVMAGVIGIPLLTVIMRRGKKIFDFEIWKYLLKFNLPLLPHYLSVAVITRIGEITVERVYGVATLGKYAVSMSVGLSLTMITGGLLSALSPWMMRRMRGRETERIRKLLDILTRGLCLVCLLILSVAPETVAIVTPPEYHECLPAVYPMALSVIPMFLSSAITSGQMYFERSGVSSLPAVLSAIVSVALSLLLLPRVDYRFAAVTVLLSYLLMAVLNSLIFKRLSGEYPIYVKKTAFTLVITVLYAILLLLLRGVLLSRLLLALPLLPMLAVCAKNAWCEIREIKAKDEGKEEKNVSGKSGE